MKTFRKNLLAASVAAVACFAHTAPVLAADDAELEEMVVTGVKTELPLTLVTDPKKPRQPLPANDGADYLKTIPGFSVIRKGGSGGDPVLRGMAGSRLSMLLDGETILGGCGGRMDPPTAYIFPETLDVIRVIKGPQTVQHGPGNSAGVVLFERENTRPAEPEWDVYASLLAGSAERQDSSVDVSYSSPEFSVRGSAVSASAGDYEDGDGVEVHSGYDRWNTQLSLAWTPDENTRFELGSTRSDAEAAYADRILDGTTFARENYSAKFIKKNISGLIDSIEVHGYFNYVDHVMDNYTLREPSGMMSNPAAMNPDRETTGGKIALTMSPSSAAELVVGLDTQGNEHSKRGSMNQSMMDYRDQDRVTDAEFDQVGLFSELSWELNPGRRLVGGIRFDDWQAEDKRETISLTNMMSVPNPTANEERQEVLHSGFLRYESKIAVTDTTVTTLYAGLGHNQRFPDYWELIGKETEDSITAMDIDPEETTQLDIGMIYRSEKLSGSVSVFYNQINDYLMIETDYEKTVMNAGVPSTRTTTIVRNIDARSWGMEADLNYQLHDNWRSELTLASVRGANDTDDTTLPQLPPLETRLGLYYELPQWSAGVLWRSIASQDRVDIGKGNIAGQDFGPTDSANVVSLNAGWRPTKTLLITAGIDNLLDETYAEHLSRSGDAIPGFDQLTRVNEPGRTLWMKAVYRL